MTAKIDWREARAPSLAELFTAATQTIAPTTFFDPCDQNFITATPQRAQRCAEAGIPTTITLPDGTTRPWTNVPGSGVLGFNSGNPELTPEVGKSWTLGAVIQPRFLPGFALTIDYHNIRIEQAIANLTAQAIVSRCYDDPVTIDNPFCAVVFRRRTPGNQITDFTFNGQTSRRFAGFPDFIFPSLGPGFISQSFNFQQLRSEGIDFDLSYRRSLFGIGWDIRDRKSVV
jgi:outer membrane receptor protein involved in Fe transport